MCSSDLGVHPALAGDIRDHGGEGAGEQKHGRHDERPVEDGPEQVALGQGRDHADKKGCGREVLKDLFNENK